MTTRFLSSPMAAAFLAWSNNAKSSSLPVCPAPASALLRFELPLGATPLRSFCESREVKLMNIELPGPWTTFPPVFCVADLTAA